MGIALDIGTRQTRAVDQRGMVERFAEQRRTSRAERRQHRQVRHVAGAEIQRLRLWDVRRQPARQFVLELRMRQRMAADQVRCPAARTVAMRAFGQRVRDRAVIGQAQVVVAAEREQRRGRGVDPTTDWCGAQAV
jgi:hypothetical protein